MKRFAIIALALLFAAPLLAQDKVWFDGTLDDAAKLAKKENKLLLINFYQDG